MALSNDEIEKENNRRLVETCKYLDHALLVLPSGLIVSLITSIHWLWDKMKSWSSICLLLVFIASGISIFCAIWSYFISKKLFLEEIYKIPEQQNSENDDNYRNRYNVCRNCDVYNKYRNDYNSHTDDGGKWVKYGYVCFFLSCICLLIFFYLLYKGI